MTLRLLPGSRGGGGCGRFERLTLRAAEGEPLSPDQVRFLGEHAGACATCGALAAVDRAVAASPGAGWEGMDELTARRVLRRVVEDRPRPGAAPVDESQPARERARQRREVRRWVAAAASAAAVLLVGGWALTASFRGRGPEPARTTLVTVMAWPSPGLGPERVALAQRAAPRLDEVRSSAPEPVRAVAAVAPAAGPDPTIVRQAENRIRRAQAARNQAQRRAAQAEQSERQARLEAERAKQRLEQLLVKEREEIARQRARRSRIILDLPDES
jgi:hypothetical protein